MSIIDTLITNRTQSDVTRWRTLHDKGWGGMTAGEKTEWFAGVKGAYNAADLNGTLKMQTSGNKARRSLSHEMK